MECAIQKICRCFDSKRLAAGVCNISPCVPGTVCPPEVSGTCETTLWAGR